jgi:hypothetical protein
MCHEALVHRRCAILPILDLVLIIAVLLHDTLDYGSCGVLRHEMGDAVQNAGHKLA